MAFADEIKHLQDAVIDNFREAELVVVYPADDPWTPVKVPGVFDDEATFQVFGEDITYTSSGPVLGIRDSDHQAKRGDEVEIPCKGRFRTVDVRPDGHGFSVLVLEKI